MPKKIDWNKIVNEYLNFNGTAREFCNTRNITKGQLLFSRRSGITKSWRKDPYRDEVWQNSGLGLYMVSVIIKSIGRFEIASGNSKLVVKDNFKEYKNYKIKGTEVLVVINTNAKLNVRNIIKEVSIKGNEIANS